MRVIPDGQVCSGGQGQGLGDQDQGTDEENSGPDGGCQHFQTGLTRALTEPDSSLQFSLKFCIQ